MVATLDMAKAYDKVNTQTLIQDCKQVLKDELTEMLPACLQPLTVTIKGDVIGNTRGQGEGLNRRGLPLIKWKKEPPIYQGRSLCGETKRLLLKWYIGNFPIPRRGARVPRDAAKTLEQLRGRENHGRGRKRIRSTEA